MGKTALKITMSCPSVLLYIFLRHAMHSNKYNYKSNTWKVQADIYFNDMAITYSDVTDIKDKRHQPSLFRC